MSILSFFRRWIESLESYSSSLASQHCWPLKVTQLSKALSGRQAPVCIAQLKILASYTALLTTNLQLQAPKARIQRVSVHAMPTYKQAILASILERRLLVVTSITHIEDKWCPVGLVEARSMGFEGMFFPSCEYPFEAQVSLQFSVS